MRTREYVGEDHDHVDQANSHPYSPGGAALRLALTPASQAPLERQRALWDARNVDPRTLVNTAQNQEPRHGSQQDEQQR